MNATDAEACAYVLNVVADDYESIDTVRKEACQWAAEEGKALSLDDASQALLRMQREGLIDCYRFDAARGVYVAETVSDSGSLEGRWFLISAKGLAKLRE